jgi:hypothetical protein
MFEARRSLEMAIADLQLNVLRVIVASMSEEVTGMFASLDEPDGFWFTI